MGGGQVDEGGGQKRNSLPNVPAGPQSSLVLLLYQPTPHHNLASSLNFGETEAQRKRLSCKHGLGSRKLKFQLRLLGKSSWRSQQLPKSGSEMQPLRLGCSLVTESLPSKLSPTVIDQTVTGKLRLKFDSRAPGGLTPSVFLPLIMGRCKKTNHCDFWSHGQA